MDQAPPLIPIVIPPLDVTLDMINFTCAGDGLLNNGHKFDPNVTSYLPLLEPARTKAGKVRVHQPHIKKQPLAYWTAQCIFRGLSQKGTISSLQDQLRGSNLGMREALSETEKRLNKEFREKNAAARDQRWNRMESNEEKAEMDPQYFLREFFHLDNIQRSDHNEEIVVLKTHRRAELHQAAELLKLEHNSIDAPRNVDGSKPSINRWIIISRTRSALAEKTQAIGRESVRIKRKLEEASQKQIKKLNESITAEAKKSGKDVWDVTGRWSIKCPYIESNWGCANDTLTLDIQLSKTNEGTQMWADFDFNVLTGIFRFIRPTPASCPKKSPLTKAPLKRKRRDEDEEDEDEDDDEDEDEDEEDSDDSSTPKEFILTANDKPSSKLSKWNFRW